MNLLGTHIGKRAFTSCLLFSRDIYIYGNWFRFKLKLIVCRCGSDWMDDWRSLAERWTTADRLIEPSMGPSLDRLRSRCSSSPRTEDRSSVTVVAFVAHGESSTPRTANFQWHRLWRIYQNEIFIISHDYEWLGFVYSGSFKLQPSVGTPKLRSNISITFHGGTRGRKYFFNKKAARNLRKNLFYALIYLFWKWKPKFEDCATNERAPRNISYDATP